MLQEFVNEANLISLFVLHNNIITKKINTKPIIPINPFNADLQEYNQKYNNYLQFCDFYHLLILK